MSHSNFASDVTWEDGIKLDFATSWISVFNGVVPKLVRTSTISSWSTLCD